MNDIGTHAVIPVIEAYFECSAATGGYVQLKPSSREGTSNGIDTASQTVLPTLDGGSDSNGKPTFKFTSVKQLYEYAVAITLSRHFTNQDYVALIPIFDLFNGR